MDSIKIANLAGLMGVSARDAEDFVIGVSMQVNKGLQLEEAIRAHQQLWANAYEAYALSNGRQYRNNGEVARQFVVGTFFQEA